MALTRNEMAVVEGWTTAGRFGVTGVGCEPHGEVGATPAVRVLAEAAAAPCPDDVGELLHRLLTLFYSLRLLSKGRAGLIDDERIGSGGCGDGGERRLVLIPPERPQPRVAA